MEPMSNQACMRPKRTDTRNRELECGIETVRIPDGYINPPKVSRAMTVPERDRHKAQIHAPELMECIRWTAACHTSISFALRTHAYRDDKRSRKSSFGATNSATKEGVSDELRRIRIEPAGAVRDGSNKRGPRLALSATKQAN